MRAGGSYAFRSLPGSNSPTGFAQAPQRGGSFASPEGLFSQNRLITGSPRKYRRICSMASSTRLAVTL